MDRLKLPLLGAVLLCAAASTAAGAVQEGVQGDFPLMSLERDPESESFGRPWRTFEANLGAAYTAVTSSILLSRTGTSASLSVDAESVLGLDREAWSPQVWLSFRIGDTHRIQLSLADLTRSATSTLEEDVVFNGTTYPAGASVHSEFGILLGSLGYVWSFLQDDRMDIGISLGVNVIRARVSIENPPRRESERLIVPIPLPGFQADFALSRYFWLRQRLDLMYVPLTHYSGLLIDYKFALELSIFENLSVGVGLNLLRLQLEKDSSDTTWGTFEGELKMHTSGVLLYLNVHW
ncbi:MAG: hypothetical protein L0170_05380 [Acidobacteria bacterium]|nr:hypothetical protein [Acidobacteriota bacterium]